MHVETTETVVADHNVVNRRSIVKTAAWTAPVIAAVVAAPVTAASVTYNIGVEFSDIGILDVAVTGIGLIPLDLTLHVGLAQTLTVYNNSGAASAPFSVSLTYPGYLSLSLLDSPNGLAQISVGSLNLLGDTSTTISFPAGLPANSSVSFSISLLPISASITLVNQLIALITGVNYGPAMVATANVTSPPDTNAADNSDTQPLTVSITL